MAELIDLSGGQELRDGTGRTVGVFLPADAAAELTAEYDRLRQEVDRLSAESRELKARLYAAQEEFRDKAHDIYQKGLDRLRHQAARAAEVTRERDEYLKSLYVLLRKDFAFTPEELAEMEKTGGPIDDIVEEAERTLRSGGK
jgi:hypothetical protein